MFVAETKIKNEWEQLAGVTFESDVTYIIVNSSSDIIYAIEHDSTPSADLTGVPVLPFNFIKYEKGNQNLYLRNGKQGTKDIAGVTKIEYSRVIVNRVGDATTPAVTETEEEA